MGIFPNLIDAARGLVFKVRAQAGDVLFSNGERARTQRDAILAFAVRVLSAGLLYLTQIVLVRRMGGFEYGIYVSVWTWVLILGGASHLGWNLASIRLAPVYRETPPRHSNADLAKPAEVLTPIRHPGRSEAQSRDPGPHARCSPWVQGLASKLARDDILDHADTAILHHSMAGLDPVIQS